ncbi:MAG: hypothetical protein Q8R44_04205 [Novosphingobium sp.]|nr:hypothetical protein [Novosphingobium sp.]
MIVAFLGAIAGLGAFALLLHRLTINALLLFLGLAGGIAALNAGLGIGPSLVIALGSIALCFGLPLIMIRPGMPVAAQLGARTIFAIPAAAAAWSIAHGLVRPSAGSSLLAYAIAAIAAIAIGLRAWSSPDRPP